jgi:hypothetical protein
MEDVFYTAALWTHRKTISSETGILIVQYQGARQPRYDLGRDPCFGESGYDSNNQQAVTAPA